MQPSSRRGLTSQALTAPARLLTYRASNIQFIGGSLQKLEAANENCLKFLRYLENYLLP